MTRLAAQTRYSALRPHDSSRRNSSLRTSFGTRAINEDQLTCNEVLRLCGMSLGFKRACDGLLLKHVDGFGGFSIPWQTCTTGLVDKALTYWIRRKCQAEHVLNNYTHSDKQRAVIGCVREGRAKDGGRCEKCCVGCETGWHRSWKKINRRVLRARLGQPRCCNRWLK